MHIDLSCFVSLMKMVHSKRKEFATPGSKQILIFRAGLFAEGASCAGKQTGNYSSCFSYQNWSKPYQVYPVPFQKSDHKQHSEAKHFHQACMKCTTSDHHVHPHSLIRSIYSVICHVYSYSYICIQALYCILTPYRHPLAKKSDLSIFRIS